MTVKEMISDLTEDLQLCQNVISAVIYGSWLSQEKLTDIDVAIVIPSSNGVVENNTYLALKELRESLALKLDRDIDLVPHTSDEFKDKRSPLYYPRYNPSLIFGRRIKGHFPIEPIYDIKKKFGFKDLTAYVLYDNRTICRRQLMRTLDGEAGRIYVSKLIHGLGNALTYYSCSVGKPFLTSPSDLSRCQYLFDEVYSVNTSLMREFFDKCKTDVNFNQATMLMYWYENLLNLVLKGKEFAEKYQIACEKVARGHIVEVP